MGVCVASTLPSPAIQSYFVTKDGNSMSWQLDNQATGQLRRPSTQSVYAVSVPAIASWLITWIGIWPQHFIV